MWLYAGLVCCDLEGSSHGAMGLREMRGVTTGNRPGNEKKNDPNTVKFAKSFFFLPSTSTFYKHFPSFTYYTVSPSVWLCLNRLFFFHSFTSQFSATKPHDFFLLSLHVTIKLHKATGAYASFTLNSLRARPCMYVHMVSSS